MLVNCNLGCRLGISTTIAKLDMDTDQAICMECGDEVYNISSFCKQNMKNSGDVLRKKKSRAFSFECVACETTVETMYSDDGIIGVGCSSGDCSFNIPSPMVEALKQHRNYNERNISKDE